MLISWECVTTEMLISLKKHFYLDFMSTGKLRNVDRNTCREGSLQLTPRKHGSRCKTYFITLKSVLAFQTLTTAMLRKWATTHERIAFLGKTCSLTLLSGSGWLQTPIHWLYQFVQTSESTFWFFKKTCWWLTGCSVLSQRLTLWACALMRILFHVLRLK